MEPGIAVNVDVYSETTVMQECHNLFLIWCSCLLQLTSEVMRDGVAPQEPVALALVPRGLSP
jgi:hypothetical protein